MQKQLRLTVLGSPSFSIDDTPVVAFNSNKTRALLVYLALMGREQTRPALAGLFWGDLPEEKAQTNLRKSVANLKKLVGDWLLITRQTIGMRPNAELWIDAREFEGLSSAENPTSLQQAATLYHGDFLDGFYLPDAPEFEHWVLAQRTRWRELLLNTLHQLIQHHERQRDYTVGIQYAQRLLALEPWREEVHRQLMWLYVRSGQRSAALAQFERCQAVLWDELGVEVSAETSFLHNRILHLPTPNHNLPPDATPLVGRSAEIAHIDGLWRNPDCRLITIVGPGGIGKTRLALSAARHLIDHLLEGVWLIHWTLRHPCSGQRAKNYSDCVLQTLVRQ